MSNDPDKHGLDVFLDAAREAPPQMPEGLSARIIQDALAQPVLRPSPIAAANGWRDLWAIFGSCALAACLGLWIGFNPPQSFEGTGLWTSTDYAETFEFAETGWVLDDGDEL